MSVTIMLTTPRVRTSHVCALAGVLVIFDAAAGCRAPVQRAGPSRIDLGAVEPIEPPATGSATSQQLTTSGDRMILSWLALTDAGATLTFAERTSSGWSDPRAVSPATEVVANAADVPSVRAL